MTLAEKLAVLPPKNNVTARQRSVALNARLSLLLETVRAYTEAVDTVNNMPYERDNGQARIAALNSRDEASLDLRTLQAHLEGERA